MRPPNITQRAALRLSFWDIGSVSCFLRIKCLSNLNTVIIVHGSNYRANSANRALQQVFVNRKTISKINLIELLVTKSLSPLRPYWPQLIEYERAVTTEPAHRPPCPGRVALWGGGIDAPGTLTISLNQTHTKHELLYYYSYLQFYHCLPFRFLILIVSNFCTLNLRTVKSYAHLHFHLNEFLVWTSVS